MEEEVIQFIKKDKELQKHIWKMYLKSDDMFASYYIVGILLFINIFLIFVNPFIFIPITIATILIEIYLIFKKKYTLDVYEVKEIYDNIISSKLKYYDCVLAKPGNKKLDGYVNGKIIKNRKENINIGEKVIAIKVGKEIIVTKYKD